MPSDGWASEPSSEETNARSSKVSTVDFPSWNSAEDFPSWGSDEYINNWGSEADSYENYNDFRPSASSETLSSEKGSKRSEEKDGLFENQIVAWHPYPKSAEYNAAIGEFVV